MGPCTQNRGCSDKGPPAESVGGATDEQCDEQYLEVFGA